MADGESMEDGNIVIGGLSEAERAVLQAKSIVEKATEASISASRAAAKTEGNVARYWVVRNDEGYYSIWPRCSSDPPLGWKFIKECPEGVSQVEAEELIKKLWKDMTPTSVASVLSSWPEATMKEDEERVEFINAIRSSHALLDTKGFRTEGPSHEGVKHDGTQGAKPSALVEALLAKKSYEISLTHYSSSRDISAALQQQVLLIQIPELDSQISIQLSEKPPVALSARLFGLANVDGTSLMISCTIEEIKRASRVGCCGEAQCKLAVHP